MDFTFIYRKTRAPLVKWSCKTWVCTFFLSLRTIWCVLENVCEYFQVPVHSIWHSALPFDFFFSRNYFPITVQHLLFSYSVKDMYGERKYLVNMNMSFCFESSGACLLSFKILEDTLLPKVLCSWDSTPGDYFITYIYTLKMKWILTWYMLQGICNV